MLKVNFTPFPILTTERLVLRQLNLTDVDDLHKLRTDNQVIKYLDRGKESLEETKYFIQRTALFATNNESVIWAMALKTNDRLVGTACFWGIKAEHYRSEIGYMLLPAYQGKGLMQETLAAIIKYGFETMKLHSIEANVNPDNLASIKVLERNRFVREGYFKENYYSNGKFSDSAIYSLVKGW